MTTQTQVPVPAAESTEFVKAINLTNAMTLVLTIDGLSVLHRTRPDTPRPYRAVGYPVLPAIYIVMAIFIDVVLLRYKPQYTWPGLIIVLLGIPLYLF